MRVLLYEEWLDHAADESQKSIAFNRRTPPAFLSFLCNKKTKRGKKKEQNTYKGNRRLFFLSLSLSLSPTAFLPSLVSSVSQLRLKHRRRCQARRLLPGDILFFIRGFPQFRSDLFLIPKQISGQSSHHYLPLSSLIFFSSFKRKKIRLQLPLCQAPYGRCVPRCLCLCVSRKKGPRNTSAVTSVSSSVAAETRALSTIRTRRKSLLDSVFRSWCDFQILFLCNIKRREIVKKKSDLILLPAGFGAVSCTQRQTSK